MLTYAKRQIICDKLNFIFASCSPFSSNA